ncbi:MAG: extracellular solute-binding protein [Mucilaginibacter sp.]|nr:extracellular solute-binding protein [Mucilaginibacter sp.]
MITRLIQKVKISVVSYPFAANTMLLAYNKKFFDDPENKKTYLDQFHQELKVPSTWEEYKRIAAFFTNKNKGTYGICMEGAAGGWLYYEWCQYLQGFGGKVMDKEWGWMGDENTKVNVNSAIALQSTEYMMSLKPYNAGGFINTDGNEQIKVMKEGKTAMCLIWSDYVRGLTYNGDETDPRFGVSEVPGTQSMLAGGAFFISRQSKYPQESFRYVMSLFQKDTQIKLVQKGLCSPLKSAYDAEEVQEIPYIPALKASLSRGVYALEAGPDADMINSTITTYMQQVWNSRRTIGDALNAAQSEVVTKRKDIFRQLKK